MYLTTGASSISMVPAASGSGSVMDSASSAPMSSETRLESDVSLACSSLAMMLPSFVSSTTTGSTIRPVWNLISS